MADAPKTAPPATAGVNDVVDWAVDTLQDLKNILNEGINAAGETSLEVKDKANAFLDALIDRLQKAV